MRKTKNLDIGRPRTIKTPVFDRSNPDNYPTLIRFLEAQGKIKHTTYAQMMQARNMYLRCVNPEQIAKQLNIQPVLLDRWALCFAWDEERDRRMFEQFRKVNTNDRIYGKDIAQRHDRIAGSIEQVAERLLQRQSDGSESLSARDLATLASTIKSTQDIRRVARNENIEKKENKLSIQVSVPGNLDRLAGAVVDAMDRPRLTQARTKTIALGKEEHIGRDVEFETIDGNTEASEE